MEKLGFGLMRLPLLNREDPASVDLDQVCAMVDLFLERGFTYFDTAYMYCGGRSEIVLREALVKRHPRESFTVATKMPTMFLKTPGDQERIFAEQLEKCGVDYFDYYLLHNLGVENYRTAQAFGTFAYLAERKAAGQIRRLGFSFHDSPQVLEQILTGHPEVDFVQLQINYLDWDSESIQSRKCYETAVKHGKQVVVMEPVKGGSLAHMLPEAEALLRSAHPDWSIPSWGIRFAASLDHVMVVLSGMSDLEQVRDNTGYMADFQPLTEAERQTVFQAAEILRKSIAIPCTACRYCVEGCPQNIAIPEYFELYNTSYQMGGRTSPAVRMRYGFLQRDHGKASDCVACGQCESACPQHIEIISWLKKVAAALED